jgi:hypothetical protein
MKRCYQPTWGKTGLWEAKNLKDEILGVSPATRRSRSKPAGRSTSSPVLLKLEALMLVPCPLATFLNRLPGISTFPFDRSHPISCPANIRYVGIQFDEASSCSSPSTWLWLRTPNSFMNMPRKIEGIKCHCALDLGSASNESF